MTIAVFGSVNIDVTAYVSTLPRAGVTAHASSYEVGLGGKGANQAVAAQKLSNQRVRLVAAIGDDDFGARATRFLSNFGVSTDDLVVIPGANTGLALIHVDPKSENSITVIGGANSTWPESGPSTQAFGEARVALFQLETPLPATAAAMRAAREAGALVILDPAPAPIGQRADEIGDLLQLADVVTPNISEASAIAGVRIADRSSALRAARAFCTQGAAVAVVKLGADGLVFACADGVEGDLDPFQVNAVDSVAAGDCFNGGLAAALHEARPLSEALSFAAAAGALATTRRGAATAAPNRAEIASLMDRSV